MFRLSLIDCHRSNNSYIRNYYARSWLFLKVNSRYYYIRLVFHQTERYYLSLKIYDIEKTWLLQWHVSLHVQANENWIPRARNKGSGSLEYSLIDEGCFRRFKLRLWLGGKPSRSGHPRLISLPRQTNRPCLCGGGRMKRRGQGAHPISHSIDPRCGLYADRYHFISRYVSILPGKSITP